VHLYLVHFFPSFRLAAFLSLFLLHLFSQSLFRIFLYMYFILSSQEPG
jgi:hypothetical protein